MISPANFQPSSRKEQEDQEKLQVACLTNRAQVDLEQGRYTDVLESCTAAINIDNDNFKAYYRRALAMQVLFQELI